MTSSNKAETSNHPPELVQCTMRDKTHDNHEIRGLIQRISQRNRRVRGFGLRVRVRREVG